MFSNVHVAMLFAFLFAICAFLLVVHYVNDLSARYRARYIREATTDLNDVLSELPGSYIFNLSVALAALCVIVTSAIVIALASNTESFQVESRSYVESLPWIKLLIFDTVAAVVSFIAPRMYLRHRRIKRLELFNEQLVDALGSMSSALKAGFSINQAIETVADMEINPISTEFSVLIREMRVGVPLDEALEKMNQRLKIDDFELVAAAITTARQTGGELTVVFERLAAMIRERLRVNGRIKSLTAQGRLQARIISAMPYLLLIAMFYVAGDVTREFYNSLPGAIVLVTITVMIILGFLWIRKLTDIDI